MVKKLNIAIPSGGLEVDTPAEFIDERSISNCQNIEIYRQLVRQRQGGDTIGAALGERIVGQAELEVNLQTYFVRVGPTAVQVINKSTLVWSSIAHAALTATEDDQAYFAFPLLSNVRTMVFTNGVDAIRKYNGTGNDADLGGTPPKCKYLIDYKGYLVLAYVIDGGNIYESRVQWSDTGDIENWTTGDAGSTNLLDTSLPITGIARFGDFLCVHKEKDIYLGQLVSSTDVFSFTRKETAGTVAQGSIQNLPDGTQIFLARDGLRLFNGVTSTLVPSSVNVELRDFLNPNQLVRATSIIVNDLDEYWVGVAIGDQEEPETVYKYNYRTGQMYKDVRTGLMSMALYKRTASETWDEDPDPWDGDTTRWDSITELALHKQVALGFANGLTVLRSSSVSDSGTAIDSIWDTKDFTQADLDESLDIGNMLRWTKLDIWAKGSSLTVYYSTDSGSTWTSIGSLTLTSDYPGDDAPAFLYFDVISSKIRFRFRNSTVDQSWTLKQYTIDWVGREVRK